MIYVLFSTFTLMEKYQYHFGILGGNIYGRRFDSESQYRLSTGLQVTQVNGATAYQDV